MKIILLSVTLALAVITSSGMSGYTVTPAGRSIDEIIGGPRTLEFCYSFTIKNVDPRAGKTEAWIPIPLSDHHQELKEIRVEGDWKYSIDSETEYGNRFLHFDLSRHESLDRANIEVDVIFMIKRLPQRAFRDRGHRESPNQASLARCLRPDRLIPIDGVIALEAKRVVGAKREPLEQVRELYLHIVSSVTYDKSGEGWGMGDALYACDVRSGNCTDFHSLFIGEARSLGIPARFIMGFPLSENTESGVIKGYHCWAECYVETYGWIPIDASEAHKHPEKRGAFFGGLDANRVAFTIGRDIDIPGASAGPLNYIIYPHVEVDGVPHSEVETSFSFTETFAPKDRL